MEYNLYSGNALDKLYLSPYCSAEVSGSALNLYQYLFDRNVSIDLKTGEAKKLCDSLAAGILLKDLTALLSRYFQQGEAEEYVYLMMQSGVLE